MLIEFFCDVNWSWTFVCWKIFNPSFNFITLMGVFTFSISSRVSLAGLYFLSISSRLSIFILHIFFIVVSYEPLFFCSVTCNFFFISNFIDLCPLSLFLDESHWSFINLFILSKNNAVAWTLCVGLTLSSLPQTACFTLLPAAPDAPPLFHLISLLVRAFLDMGTSPLPLLPYKSHPSCPLLFLLFFLSSYLAMWGSFLSFPVSRAFY